ncbi:sugar ABC transporter substrate-binding protein [Egibacter rhizosphaerae]|uniref:Sugar ABC transporter substrate-binding protein n=1 Tax=Egibacter rhizosphaerae TaxID=1670831 RepID=A0A411YL15_9ACTN|nr:sugar ABC transporter substrate-binding protein [Egibacter rhizosphaerae]
MRMSTTIRTLVGALTLALALAACGTEEVANGDEGADGEGGLVGVAMPTETSERWIADGAATEAGLEEAGYEVELQFAGDDIPTQQDQIDQMITQGVEALIIAAIDGTALSGQLDAAAAEGIPVVSYDRLIRDNENVDFYVTFDNYNVGVQQATALLVGLGLLDEDGNEGDAEGPINVELFAGSLDDNNAHFFWDGAMDTLEPYFDDGTLEVPSGQMDIEQAATLRWSQEEAQSRMDDLLTAHYSDDTELDGVLSAFDGLSRGIITALENAGFPDTIEEGMPIITGQDAEIASVTLIDQGVQDSTIFKDTRLLAEQGVTAVQAFLEGDEPEPNDTETYDNGVKVVPSYLLDSTIIYDHNIEQELVETGYYTADEVEAGQ